jgi:diguanylate cyclase (GGDEF)-like protein
MRRRQRHEAAYAVLFIDCDHFKLINDSLGHLAGDHLLVEMSRRISQSLRTSDTLARLGGDEFAVLAEDLESRDDAVGVAERMRAALAEPFLLEGQEYYLTTSIGVAFGSADYATPSELLRDADTAMYGAKANGRDRYVVFERGMHLSAVSQLQVGNDLRRAVDRDELLVYYQPIIRLADGRLAGFEALVRWQHPTRGLIQPDQFISVAEKTGLIHPIGEWVLRQASRQLVAWRQRYPVKSRELFLSVNLAPSQLQRAHIVDELTEIVRETGEDPSSIRLEITESGIMENPLTVKVKLDALKAKGFRLAIDDFGTGYSSLAHLHRFPIDTLKVDRSFVAPILQGDEHLEIVRTILMLGRTLNMTVVAEGVETAGQDSLLKGLLCTYAQGWFYARPLAPYAADAFLAHQAIAGAPEGVRPSD